MKLLVVEDDAALQATLVRTLLRRGFGVTAVGDGAAALERWSAAPPDAVVLDLTLPTLDGLQVLAEARARSLRTPVLILTARGTVGDRVLGLNTGADDYLAKPFAYVELLARLRALARRTTATSQTVLAAGGVCLDTVRHVAERDGRPLSLTPKELGVLEALLRASGGYVHADELLDEVWDHAAERSRSVVKFTVHTLRRKLGGPEIITTGPGLGYRIEAGA